MRRVLVALLSIIIFMGASTAFAGGCGDVDNSGNVDILDVVYLINFKYKDGPAPLCDKVTDNDGNVYQTVIIGTQVWMMENLRGTHYRNGDPIPIVTDNTEWADLGTGETGGSCAYDNDVNNVATYGRLYNWYAVIDSRNIAPVGWHIPSEAEWQTLADYLGGDAVAGGKMKEVGLTHWDSPNTGATNESGFSGLPGGNRDDDGTYGNMGSHAWFWSSTEYDGYYKWNRSLYWNNSGATPSLGTKRQGISVRCVQD